MNLQPDVPGRLHPGLPIALAGSGALVTGVIVQTWLTGNTRAMVILVSTILLTSMALLASIGRARRPGKESKGWKLLSISLLISFLLQGSHILVFFGWAIPPGFDTSTMVLSLLGYGLQIGALLVWHLAPQNRFDRVRQGLDGLLFALSIFFILWGLVLGPAFLNDRFPIGERLQWLATFLVYDLLLGLAVYLGLPEPARFRGPLGWLAAAFLFASLHNFMWLLDALSGTPVFEFPQGPPIIFIIPLAYLGAALSPHAVGSAAVSSERQLRITHLLPYFPVLGATALGIWMLARGITSSHHPMLVWLALGLVLILLVRQYLALRDFAVLSQHLESRVSERTLALEKAQVLLLKTERLNSVATLGAGLAHDMNNLLCAILGRTELQLMNLDEGTPPDRSDLVRIQDAAQLAASLSSRLMTIGRQDPEPPIAMELGQELLALKPLLQVLLPRNQTMVLDCPASPMPFRGTRGMLDQVLVNLVSNARDAIPAGGTVTIRARPPRPDEGSLGPILEVEDTGSGIPLENQALIFQSFFTTKPSGTGTGLGLASVKSLLERMGGSILFTSQEGLGTTFQVHLPRLPEAL